MLRVESVAERMGDDLVCHDPTMPRVGKTAKTVVTTRRLEDSLHSTMIASLLFRCKSVLTIRRTD
jgi:hypothetical protein